MTLALNRVGRRGSLIPRPLVRIKANLNFQLLYSTKRNFATFIGMGLHQFQHAAVQPFTNENHR